MVPNHKKEALSGPESTLTEAQIRSRLSRNLSEISAIQHLTDEQHGQMVPAAVLIPLVSIKRAWHVLYILRASNVNDHHSGQVAFPGGRHESVDFDMETTALREAQEELGLVPKDVRVTGYLNDHFSITNYRIRPVVGIIPWPYPLQIDEKEVSRWFTVPLEWLADPINRETRHQRFSTEKKLIPTIYYQDYEGELLWGASARITVELTDALRD